MPEHATRRHCPLILIRGFGGLNIEDEKQLTYQGFNVGTVYPHKRGENYIFEGFILRLMKSDWAYHDATNVVGYYPSAVRHKPNLRGLEAFDEDFFWGHKVVIDPGMALRLREQVEDARRTIWVFRYYDLNDRLFEVYGAALVRLIDFIRALAVEDGEEPPKVNVIAHSMGGLIAREAIQRSYPNRDRKAADYINKLVTLGTPHQGISFQVFKEWLPIDADEEIERFSPRFQRDPKNEAAFVNLPKHFPPERILTVVGTNYRSYGVGAASRLNRFFSVAGEYGPNYNRSDGLVKQAFAQLPGAPRTFVHKCHGGPDSLATARESYEAAVRFLTGNVFVRLRLVRAKVLRGLDRFGKSEIFFGVGIKPRGVDFELFHQSPGAENCYGPFRRTDLNDAYSVAGEEGKDGISFPWAGPKRLVWEGWLDTGKIVAERDTSPNLVLRLDVYVGERDLFGIGFSDNVILRKQYYVQAVLKPSLKLYLYTSEAFQQQGFAPGEEPADAPEAQKAQEMEMTNGEWRFDVKGTGFEGTFGIEICTVPEDGPPRTYAPKDVASATKPTDP